MAKTTGLHTSIFNVLFYHGGRHPGTTRRPTATSVRLTLSPFSRFRSMDFRAHLVILFSKVRVGGRMCQCKAIGFQCWKTFWMPVGCRIFMVHQPCHCSANKIWHPFLMGVRMGFPCLRSGSTDIFAPAERTIILVSPMHHGDVLRFWPEILPGSLWVLSICCTPVSEPDVVTSTASFARSANSGTHFGALDSLSSSATKLHRAFHL